MPISETNQTSSLLDAMFSAIQRVRANFTHVTEEYHWYATNSGQHHHASSSRSWSSVLPLSSSDHHQVSPQLDSKHHDEHAVAPLTPEGVHLQSSYRARPTQSDNRAQLSKTDPIRLLQLRAIEADAKTTRWVIGSFVVLAMLAFLTTCVHGRRP
ncbi:hypothetical protein BDN72DRAFT_956276 [Pluteus cervinus]|uniref:Uncharacterized protein n=1 Tax=Pluteus cervinus TaxID=181527 RepID=A0ACD3B7A1_9AGAR|nr:hypothetical protein BDN72DRAFT_956276 [Pluteus cervinus]